MVQQVGDSPFSTVLAPALALQDLPKHFNASSLVKDTRGAAPGENGPAKPG